jgi:AcrR family transcriptional regulator
MAGPVKTRRRYDSPRRREQAAATRRQILDAAQRLFEEQGYVATSMSAIASEAGVALKTVYVAFETKAGVLRALWNLLLRGDEAPVPVAERSWYRAVIEEPDPERVVSLTAHNSRLVKVRAGAILDVIQRAAPADPDVGALWARIESEFHENQRAIVQVLEDKSALRDGLDVERGADILWTLNHPTLWRLLVGERGWTPDEFEEWLRDAVRSELLGKRRRPKRAVK